MKEPKFKLNDVVKITCNSIWAGYTGTVIERNLTSNRLLYTVRMKTNDACRVFEDDDMKAFVNPLDDQEFYELMQTYRHTPREKQSATCAAYDAVKAYLRKHAKDIYEYQA